MIDGVCLSENVVTQILSACPQLEVLTLIVDDNDNGLSICSSSLKVLTIMKFIFHYANQPMYSELRIWTPNLESLHLLGDPCDEYLLRNVSSLTHAYLGFYDPFYHENNLVPWYNSLGERLSEILSAIQHVEEVTLTHWCIQVLGTAKEKHMLAPYPNVKILQLISDCHEDYEQILGLLEMFPELQTLVLELEEDHRPIRANHEPKFETNLPNSFLLQLRTLEVYWTKGHTSFFPVIEFMLKYASRLEKVVFRKKMN